MDSQLPSDLVLLGRSLGLLCELEQALQQAGSAIVAANLRGMERQTTRQREICAAIRELQQRTKDAAVTSGEDGEVSRHLREQLREAVNRVWNLNRVQAGLVRRARRTVDIFCRVLASSAATYTPPAPTATLAWKK